MRVRRRMRMLKLPKLVRLEDGDDDLRMMVQHRGKLCSLIWFAFDNRSERFGMELEDRSSHK
jgi:hypothetical protein